MVHEGPAPGLLVVEEEREVEDPQECVLSLVDQAQVGAEMRAQRAEHAFDHRLAVGHEEDGRVRRGAKCLELGLGEELRDRRTHLAGLVDDEVGEPLRTPLLRELLEASELRARERTRHDEIADHGRTREHAELRSARHLRRVLDLETEAHVGLVGPIAEHRLGIREPREGTGGRRPTRGFERRDDDPLEHLEHVLPDRKRELEIELPEFELAIGAKILVAPAGCDLVVAVEPADHEQLLEQLRRLREREELARLQPDGDEEVARSFRRADGLARSPDVDEAQLVHRLPDRADHARREAEVPLHPVPPQVEVAVAQADGLVDVLLVELERERVGTRKDLQLVDLHLDLAGREVRVDRVGCPADDLPLGAEHELVADVVRDVRRVGRAVGVHDELKEPGVVAQVDEDETAVIAPSSGPAGERQPLLDLVGGDLTAVDVTPLVHPSTVAATAPTGTSCSTSSRLIVAPSARTWTNPRAPERASCVRWPLSERPA